MRVIEKIVCAGVLALCFMHNANAEMLAGDMNESSSTNLISYENVWTGAFGSAGDGFQKYQRGVSITIPFAVLDDTLFSFPPDTIGIIDDNYTHEFFGATDTVNGDTSGEVTATWVFDITGGSDLALSIDIGAMGDFENSDVFEWRYSIDGGSMVSAFVGSADEDAAHTYTLASGKVVDLNDPMTLQGEVLDNILRTYSVAIDGSGSALTLELVVTTNGGTEAFAFNNIQINTGGLPSTDVAFDMVGSASSNLISHTNAFAGAFGSAGDGFEKYQRGVSSTIPFSVLDDSLVSFPSDNLGIVDDNNLDEFFGVTDTVNSDNSGLVTATWVFDVSGASDLGLSIDMGAMGDFESDDTFIWSYSFDGGVAQDAFVNGVDEAGSLTYTLAGGLQRTLNDPMTMQGVPLTNVLTPFVAALTGTGSELTVTLTASTNGGSEAFAFQNLRVIEGVIPEVTPIAEIYEIQGAGASSPFDGLTVESYANVVTALGTDGFFMQTPAGRSDMDRDTSDGIFVFTGATPTVAVGDMVDVVGTVREFFGFTEFTSDTIVTVISAGYPLPDPVVFDATTPSPDPTAPSCAIEFECYEGMLVSIADGSISSPNQRFNSDPIAEVHITASARSFREPGIEFPGVGGTIPVYDGNPEVFELDPNKLGLDNQTIAAGSRFSATGVIGFEFGGYELWPTTLEIFAVELPRSVRERDRAEFTVGSLNMFRLFDSIDDPIDFNSQGRERNDAVIDEAEYQVRLTKLALYVVEVLGAPDILAVQEVEKLAVLDDLAAAISLLDASVNYASHLEEGNDVGTIDVGFMVRENIRVDSLSQIGKDEILPFDGSLLNDRPALLMRASNIGDGADFPIAAISVHNRSLGGIDSSSSGDRVRAKRLAQAQTLAAAVQALQTDEPDLPLVVIGDFNAYEFTDGYVDVIGQIAGEIDPSVSLLSADDLVDPNLWVLTRSLSEEERYSFIFRGSSQALDHALVSDAVLPSLRGVMYGRGNADAALDLINDPSSALRSSDHDGLVVYITLDQDGDGVFDNLDACPATAIPEAIDAAQLGTNRLALIDDDFVFDVPSASGNGAQRGFTTADTAGCSCSQIIEQRGLGLGQSKFGCSVGVINSWVREMAR